MSTIDWSKYSNGDTVYQAVGDPDTDLVDVQAVMFLERHNESAMLCHPRNLSFQWLVRATTKTGYGRTPAEACESLYAIKERQRMPATPSTTTRIRDLFARLGGVPEASRKTGIATSTLYQYAEHGYVTAADHLVALVEADRASVGMCAGYVRPRGADGLVVSRPRRKPAGAASAAALTGALDMETD